MYPTTLKRLLLNTHIDPSKHLMLLLECWLLLLLTSSVVNAEGSRELIVSAGGQGYRASLEFFSGSTSGIPRKGIVKVFVNAGEEVNLGSSVHTSLTDPKDIVYRSPSNVEGSCNVNSTGYGFIDTLAKELAGPKTATNSSGYDPCKFTATETGIYEIEFHAPADASGAPITKVSVQFPTGSTQNRTVSAWDVTVLKTPGLSSSEQKGRAYVSYLPLDVGKKGITLNSTVYVLTNNGFLYTINLNGVDPYQFIFFANNKGFIDKTTKQTLLRSVKQGDTLVWTVHNPANADDPANNFFTHKMFFNAPDLNLPTDAKIATNDDLPAMPGTNTWLLSAQPTPPTISGFKFTGVEGTTNQAGTVPLGGSFEFNSNTAASYSLIIKVDGGNKDRVLSGAAVNGNNTLVWDGKDNDGNPVPASNTAYEVKLSISIDDVHFPFWDIENNQKGLIIKRVNRSTLAMESDLVYYDDRKVFASVLGGTTPLSALQGIPSSGGVHAFNQGSGNAKGIDTWTSITTDFFLSTGGLFLKKADLVVTKSYDPLILKAGDTITYTITVKNNGPSDVTGVKVQDTVPTDVTVTNWDCTAISGSCTQANGTTGNIDTTVDLNSTGVAKFLITGTVSPSLVASTKVDNSVTITRPNDVTNPQGLAGSDAKVETASASFTVQAATPPNSPPTANDSTTPATINTNLLGPLTNVSPSRNALFATDSDGSVASYSIVTVPLVSEGVLFLGNPTSGGKPIVPGSTDPSVVSGQNLTASDIIKLFFQPDINFNGNATFTYHAQDNLGAFSNLATVTIPVTANTNNPPVPVNKIATPIINDNTAKSLSPAGDLSATDPNNDSIASYTITAIPDTVTLGILSLCNASPCVNISPGMVINAADVSKLYFKPASTVGDMTILFEYTATDSKGATSLTVATISIPVIAPPTAYDKTTTATANNVTLQLPANTLSAMDMGISGSIISYTIVTLPLIGQGELYLGDPSANLKVTTGQTLTPSELVNLYFKPNSSFTGDAKFTYRATDNDDNPSNVATVTIPVTSGTVTNQPPVAKDKLAPSTPNDQTIQLPALEATDDGTVVTYTVVTLPDANTQGTLYIGNPAISGQAISSSGKILSPDQISLLFFQPKAGFTGAVKFTYTAMDNQGLASNTATVTIPVTAPDNLPVANNDSATTTSDKPVTIPILANDQNVDPKTLTITSQPAHGTVTKNPDGTVTYTPTNPTFTGTDTFTYQVCDSGNHCKTATVTVTVTAPPVTPPPPVTVILNNDQATANPGQPVTIPVLANDHNVDPNSLVIISPPKNGQAKVNPDGTITYTPNPGFSGQDLFTYQVCDTQGACTTATITVDVAPPPPLVGNDTANTAGDQPVTIAVLDNDPNGTGTMTIATPPQNGNVTVNPDNTLTYTPNPNFTGTDTFTYQICDTLSQCDTATVTINVAGQPVTTPPHTLFIAFSGNGTGNVVSLPAGINCNNTSPTCQATYNNGISVSLQATPNPESEFTGWGGDSDCNDGNVMMNKEVHCLAYFNLLTLPKFQLTVATQGEGTVVTQPVGIDCGSSCEAGYPSNVLVSATATPQPGFTFAGWSGDCSGTGSTILITMNQAKTCLATFDTLPTLSPDQHRLIITKSGLGNGTITSNVPGIDCGPTCSSVYPYNTLLTVTAVPDPGSQFIGWSIHCLGTDAAVNVLMDSDKSCIAVFDLEQPPLPLEEGEETLTIQNLTVHKITVVSDPVGIQITPQHSYGAKSTAHYPLGTVVKLQVTPEPGFKLIGFQGDADCYDGQVTVTKSLTCYPLLERDNYQINHGVIQFSSPNYIVDEFGTPTTLITVTRTGGCDGPVTVDYLSADGSANAPADYTSVSGTLSWAAGDCRDKIITLPVQDDKLFEEGESLQLKLLNPTGNAIIGPLANATVIIRDDDAQTPSTPTGNGACYNLAPCQVCCSDCQTTDTEETGLQFKTLILTIKVGQTVGLGLADGQGDLLLKELPNRDLVSLESWQPQGKGAGELTFKGLKVGTTKLLIVDSAAPAKTATIQIKVIPADDNSDSVATTTSSHFGIEALLTTIKVGQTLSVTVAGGQGRLSLSQTPDTDLVALTSWIPLGNTGTGEITLTGLSVGNTEAVIIDQANPAHQTSINLKVIPGEGDLATADNPLTVGEDGTLLWQGQPLAGADATFDQDNCGDNAWGFDAKGESLESPDCFIGQLSIGDQRTPNHRMFSHEEAKTLTIADTTIIAPAHIGLTAEVLLVGVRTTLTNETRYAYDGDQWIKWDGRLDSFPVAEHHSKLPELLTVPIYKGDLSFAPGEYTVFVGYRLSHGTIIYNGKTPIHFYIGNAASVDLRSDSPKTITSQEVYSTAYFESFVHNGQKGMDAKIGNDLLFETQEGINVSTFVRIDSLHVGQPANILIVATYQPAAGGDLRSYVRQGYLWFPWDGKLNSLVPAQHYHQLPKTMEIPIYLGNLANLPGQFRVFVGYHLLDENVIIFNGLDPVQVTVADTSTPLETGATRSLFINNTAPRRNPFGSPTSTLVGQTTTLLVAPTDIGQMADIMMIVLLRQTDSDKLPRWEEWDNSSVILKVILPQVTLPAVLNSLPGFETDHFETGKYIIYWGYRLQNGTMVYNGWRF